MSHRVDRGSGPGFSLVELLLVIVVLGIAVNLAVPMMGSTEASRLRAAARLLVSDLAVARIGSITHSEDPCVVVFEPGKGAYRVARASEPGTPITNEANRRPYRVQFGRGRASQMQGVKIASVSLGGDRRLGFGRYGELDQAEPARITLRTANHELELTLAPATGQVRVGQIE